MNRKSTIPSNSLENTALEVFGLDRNAVESLSSVPENDLLLVCITLRAGDEPCPNCGHLHPRIHAYTTKRIVHSILQTRKCQILYRSRRYKCPLCHRTWFEKNPFVIGRNRISIETMIGVMEALRDSGATFSSVASRFNLSPTTVQNIFDQCLDVPQASQLPRVMQIDETYSFKSENSKFVCMILDFEKQTAVDLLPTRKKEDLLEFFKSFPKAERDKVEFIAADMYATYRNVCKKVFPNAIYAVDRFHVMQEFIRRFQDVRIRIMKGTRKDSDEYYLLKKHHDLMRISSKARRKKKYKSEYENEWEYVLDPNGERLHNYHFKKPMNNYELLDLLLCIDPHLTEAYEIMHELSAFFRDEELETAPKRLAQILDRLNRSQVPEMNKFGRTVANWYEEIINSFYVVKEEYRTGKNGKVKRKRFRLTSSLIENRNKIVKQIKNNANGYTNWTRFRKRVMYVLNKLPYSLELIEEKKK